MPSNETLDAQQRAVLDLLRGQRLRGRDDSRVGGDEVNSVLAFLAFAFMLGQILARVMKAGTDYRWREL